MYVYRALRNNEFYNNIIWCKEYFANAPYFEYPKYNNYFGADALDLVGSHITHGNTSITPWISCTKDYDSVQHFLYEGEKFAYALAVIKNHDKDKILSHQCYKLGNKYLDNEITREQLISRVRRLTLSDIRKCVLDFSSGESELFRDFVDAGFVHLLKNGKLRNTITEREKNYTRYNKEVLVLGSISQDDAYILDPLKIDIIDYLKKNNIITALNDELLGYLVNSLRIVHTMLVDEEIEPEDMLTEPLKSAFNSMDDYSKYIFECLYLYNCNKNQFIKKNNLTREFLDYMVDSIIKIVINNSEYLTELTRQQSKNTQQKVLVTC